MLQDPASRTDGEALLARADELLTASRAAGLADGSDLLPSGLTRRFASELPRRRFKRVWTAETA